MPNFMLKSSTLCEINFGHFEASKTAILTIWAALNFEFWELLILWSVKYPKTQNSNPLKSAKIDFTKN